MFKRFFVLVGLFLIVVGCSYGIEFNWNIPNAEPITMCYDNIEKEWFNCFTSRVLTLGDFEGRLGGIGGKLIGAFTYDICNLEKLSIFGKKIVVEGIVKDMPIILGFYGSYDFNNKIASWGEMVLSLQIGIK